MMQQVIATLLEIVNGGEGILRIVSFAQMSLVDCMDLAMKVNSNPEIPQIVVCSPDLSSPVVTH